MKKNIGLGVMLVLLLAPLVHAGVGLYWSTEAEKVAEGERTCITYGMYNPFEKDMTATMEATGELESLYEKTEPVFIPAETSSKERKNVEICFNIPKVYEEECLLPGILCGRTCGEEPVIYEGQVAAISTPGKTNQIGSATRSVVASPLKLVVNCKEEESAVTSVTGLAVKDASSILGIGVLSAIVLLVIIAIVIYRAGKAQKRR